MLSCGYHFTRECKLQSASPCSIVAKSNVRLRDRPLDLFKFFNRIFVFFDMHYTDFNMNANLTEQEKKTKDGNTNL